MMPTGGMKFTIIVYQTYLAERFTVAKMLAAVGIFAGLPDLKIQLCDA